MRLLSHLLVNTLVLVVVAAYFNSFYLSGIGAAFVASIVISILNVFVKPIIIFLTLPVTILTLGLFLFVVNAITLWLAAAFMGDAFVINGFGMAIIAAVVMSILSALIQKIIVEPLTKK
ncbi:phage holin family protein [Bacillus alkalicellulosilyticus]|uniref:phage holin family protein n=1 Tax=Alkalihalobacterium alkalicellulosilyticum TaxID=1912214 RepID=UPI00099841D0|nr:phage holin family protein [Bacillus alkalicellulosilyticus]